MQAAWGARAEPRELGKELAGMNFLLLRTISHFTYEMVKNQGGIAMDGNLGSAGHGCPSLPTRPV